MPTTLKIFSVQQVKVSGHFRTTYNFCFSTYYHITSNYAIWNVSLTEYITGARKGKVAIPWGKTVMTN